MPRSRFEPARQRPDRSFEWQSGTRTGPDIFVSSCETYWRNGGVFRGDLVQLNRILEFKTDCGYLGVYAPVTETREPGERGGNRPTVHEIDNQAVFVEAHTCDAFVSGCRQSSHTMPPTASLRPSAGRAKFEHQHQVS